MSNFVTRENSIMRLSGQESPIECCFLRLSYSTCHCIQYLVPFCMAQHSSSQREKVTDDSFAPYVHSKLT